MNVIRCKNGHFFDGDTYPSCPHCGEAAMAEKDNAAAKEEKKSFFGRGRKEKNSVSKFVSTKTDNSVAGKYKTTVTTTEYVGIGQADSTVAAPIKENTNIDFEETFPYYEKTTKDSNDENSGDEAPENNSFNTRMDESSVSDISNHTNNNPAGEMPSSLREAVRNASASNEGKTMSYFSVATAQTSVQSSAKRSADPVVGWLVCISGCHFGDSFSIYAGKNSVGRSEENRIVVPEDKSISRSKHALIVYEPKKRNFYLQPGDSSGLTYLNDDYITESHKLAALDIIELGDSKFMFVPLCGETFSWDDLMHRGE